MKKDTSSWVKSGSYSLLGYAAQLGLAFVSFLVLIRIMPEYDFGVWVLFLTVTSFAEMARLGLTQNAMVRFCVEEKAEYGRVLTAGFVLNTCCSILLSALLLLLAWPMSKLWSAPELITLLWWYLPFALIHGTARFIDNIQMADNDFKGVFWSKLAFGLSFLIAIIIVWQWKPEALLEYLPILQVITGVLSLAVSVAYRTNLLRFGRMSWSWFWRIFHFGKYVLGTNFSSMLVNKVDIMMVGAFINPMAVAMYNVATRITNYMEVPMSGIAQAVYPRIATAQSEAGGKAVAEWYERSVGLLAAILLPMAIGVVLLAEPIVVLLAGVKYAEAAPLLVVLVMAVIAKPWSRLFGITLDAIGRPQLNFKVLLAGLILNAALNLLLIPVWGVIGAAIASLLSIWAIAIFGQVLIQKIIPIRQRNILVHFWAFYRSPKMALKLEHH